LKPYGYVQTPEGETPFRPYIFSGASETIGSVLGSLITGTPVSKGVFKGYESSYDKADFKSRTEYVNKLFNLMSAAGGTREGYAEELQPYLSVVTEKIMGGTKVEKAAFSSAFFKGLRSRANYFELGMLVIEVIRPSAIGNLLMHSVAEGGLTGALWDVPLTVFTCGYRLGMWMKDGACTGATSLHMRIERALGDAINEAHAAKCITDQQYDEASKCTSTVATFLISYLTLDSTRDFQYTLTAAAYGANLFSPHYPSVSMAYLMAKDSNYDTAHKIKVTGWNAKLAQDAKATVYSVNEFNDKKTIATVENGQLVAAPGITLPETLTLETIQNGFIVSSAYNRADSTNEECIGVDITSSQSVAVEYTNHGNDQKGFTNVTQYFEQVEIPMTTGDTISLKVKNASAEAEFNKTISPQFVYGSHDEENGGYINITPGRRVSIDSVDTMMNDLGAVEKPLNIGTTYTFTSCDALSGNGYTPVRVYQGIRTADGSIQKDETSGQLKMTRIDSARGEYSSSPAVTWTATFDLKSTSPVYFVENVSARDSYSVQMTGVAYNAAKESVNPYGVTLRLTNETTGQAVYNQSINAKPGDVVCADVAARNTKSVFLRWKVLTSDDRLEISEGSPMDRHFTFVMPCHDVNLEALFFVCDGDDEGTLAVFNGMWASEYTPAVTQSTSKTAQKSPDDLGWEELFSEAKEGETSYLTTGSHVLRMKTDKTANSGYLFMEAPEKIEVPSGGVYVFDHWEANYFDHGNGVTDAIAQRLNISYSDTGDVLGASLVSEDEDIYYAPHGSTNPILVIPNSLMKESVVFEPIYTPEQYSYTITLTDGSIVSGKAKPGQIVNVADVSSSGRTFTSWEANYTEVTYKTKADGSKVKCQETKKLAIPNTTKDTLTFVMPHGAVTGHANYDEKLYKLNTMVEVQVEGKTLNVSDVTTVGARYEFGAGENVVMRMKYDGSKSVTGWNCNSSDVTVEPIMGPDGYVDRYTFVMPAHDVTITPISSTPRTTTER
ncbi:MAG: hypothetical protein HUJ99_02290, partial [Bacteroidaceae bacterium]|nr:hypothetical protein [Bacteroidaceae bacterium]